VNINSSLQWTYKRCNIYGSYWSQRWWSWKKCVMQSLFALCTSNYSYVTTNIACWFWIFFKTEIYECIKFFWPMFQITTFILCIL